MGLLDGLDLSLARKEIRIVTEQVHFRKENEEWEDGWKVSEIYGEIDEKHLPDAHKMVKSHRKATGDSLPK